jgi:hypothetical protein
MSLGSKTRLRDSISADVAVCSQKSRFFGAEYATFKATQASPENEFGKDIFAVTCGLISFKR